MLSFLVKITREITRKSRVSRKEEEAQHKAQISYTVSYKHSKERSTQNECMSRDNMHSAGTTTDRNCAHYIEKDDDLWGWKSKLGLAEVIRRVETHERHLLVRESMVNPSDTPPVAPTV